MEEVTVKDVMYLIAGLRDILIESVNGGDQISIETDIDEKPSKGVAEKGAWKERVSDYVGTFKLEIVVIKNAKY